MTSNIRSIASQTHPIKFEFSESGPSKATVTLAQQDSGIPLGKDFELLVALSKPNEYFRNSMKFANFVAL